MPAVECNCPFCRQMRRRTNTERAMQDYLTQTGGAVVNIPSIESYTSRIQPTEWAPAQQSNWKVGTRKVGDKVRVVLKSKKPKMEVDLTEPIDEIAAAKVERKITDLINPNPFDYYYNWPVEVDL